MANSPDRPLSLFNSSLTRHDLLKSVGKIAAVTAIGGVGAAVLRGGERSSLAASPPENPIRWVNSAEKQVTELFDNASYGIAPYNNERRPVATIYRRVDAPNTSAPTVIYQLWEGLYEETQAGPGVYLAAWGLLVNIESNKEYILTSVMASQDGNLKTFSIETIQNADKPTDYSHTGRKRTKDVLSQPGIWSNARVTSFLMGVDPANNQKYIEFSYENEYVPSEKGTQRAYLDSNGNPLAFAPIATPEPTATQVPPTPTGTPTQEPRATQTPTITPTAISRRQFLYIPIVNKSSAR